MCKIVGDLYNKDCFEAEMPVDNIDNFINHLKTIPTTTNIRIGNPDDENNAPVKLNIRVWCKGHNHYRSALEKAKHMGAEILEKTDYTCVKLKTKWLDRIIKWIDDYNLDKETPEHILCIRDCEEGRGDVFEVYSECKEHVKDLLDNFDLLFNI